MTKNDRTENASNLFGGSPKREDTANPVLWSTWNDYRERGMIEKINGREYAHIGNHYYTDHVVARMQPTGARYSLDKDSVDNTSERSDGENRKDSRGRILEDTIYYPKHMIFTEKGDSGLFEFPRGVPTGIIEDRLNEGNYTIDKDGSRIYDLGPEHYIVTSADGRIVVTIRERGKR